LATRPVAAKGALVRCGWLRGNGLKQMALGDMNST